MNPGAIVDGRFRVEARVRAGAMGVVHRAIDLAEGHGVVALKVLLQGHAEDGAADAVARFLLEASILERLSHPAIVRYIAHGSLAGGEPYLVMEWIDGPSLDARLDGRPLRVLDALLLCRRLAEALAAAHAAGVVHRDLKPANIMLPGGEIAAAKLLDFGVARLAIEGPALTATGVRIGTPRYMAPEQIKSAREVDGRADLFSLGCILFESLAGQPAFSADNAMAVLVQILFEPAPRLADLRPDLADPIVSLVQRLLARDPATRPSSAAAVAEELDRLLEKLADGTMVAPRSSLPDPALRRLVVRALPRPDGPLFGRRAELSRIDAVHVRGAAAVLWGPAGIGKSRLLVETALRGRDAPSVTVWLVDLSPVRKAHEISAAIARAVGVRAPETDTLPDTVTTALHGQPEALLLLDRVEHVATLLPAHLERLAEACPSLRIVVASRVRIQGRSAEPIEIGPLDEEDAAQLFAHRAPSTSAEAPALREICRALDHVPLALELAAARVDVLGLDGVRTRLHRRDLLADGNRTMEGAVAWSWELLSPEERRAGARCALFPGDFAVEAGEALLEGLDAPPLDLLQGLRHKSLLAKQDAGDEPRLIMLRAVRDLALGRLEPDERALTRALHRRCFVRLGEEARVAHERTGSAAAIRRLARDLGDLTAAAEHALEAGDQVDACVLSACAEPVLSSRGGAAAALTLLERALEGAPRANPAVQVAIAVRARLLGALGRALEGIVALRALLSPASADRGALLLELGVLLHVSSQLDEAKATYEEAAELLSSRDPRGEARALANLGALAHDEGSLVVAEERYREAIELFSSVGDLRLRGVTLGNLALALQEAHELEQARQCFAEAITHLEAYQDVRLLGVVLGNAGFCELEAGIPEGRAHLERAQALLAPTGDGRSLGLALGRLAAALALEGRVGEADARFARADRLLARFDPLARATVSALRAATDLRRAEDALARGAQADARAQFVMASLRVAQAEAAEHSGAFGRRSDDVRTALRLVSPRLSEIARRVHETS